MCLLHTPVTSPRSPSQRSSHDELDDESSEPAGSRSGSRSGSRPGSRPTSDAASRTEDSAAAARSWSYSQYVNAIDREEIIDKADVDMFTAAARTSRKIDRDYSWIF